MAKSFDLLRREFSAFYYDGFHIEPGEDSILIRFDFSVDDIFEFHPETRIITDNLTLLNDPFSATAQRLVFSVGLAEAVSYWKAICPSLFVIRCGYLDDEQKEWWKKLWFNGLGEFFYMNGIATDIESFLTIENTLPEPEASTELHYNTSGFSLVPVGGGKDSAVTLSLLEGIKDSLLCFTVNDQKARTDTVTAIGLDKSRIVRTYRTIDPALLKFNTEGYLNGHTPFSSVVAFLSMYCAYLTGAQHIILSNESSANEVNVGGTDVNHQYSKSYEFERDFSLYAEKYLRVPIRYFSLLRPFGELQIAKMFASLPQYHAVFRSCNVGSKKNIWCCNCAKCLFVYIILSPFLSPEQLFNIFGCNMLDKYSLKSDFDGLTGFSDVKPFECIGTVSEVNYALSLTADEYKNSGLPLPCLLGLFVAHRGKTGPPVENPLISFDLENGIPDGFMKYAKEMYDFVKSVD